MVVRFLPLPVANEPNADAKSERGDLAEVIELRSYLPRAVRESKLNASQSPAEASNDWNNPQEMSTAQEMNTAQEDGVKLLARKARSSGELRRELQSKGHDAADIEAVLLEFESSLYLDDLGLARVVVETLRERKKASRTQIRMKLRERLLPDGIIESVLSELDDEEEHEILFSAAHDRAQKMGSLDYRTAERRLLGFLARRGWSGETAMRAAREALEAQGMNSTRAGATGSPRAPSSVTFR